MFYLNNSCLVCRTGSLGFRRCSDGKSIVVMCDECEAVWDSPNLISTSNVLDAAPPDFEVQGLGVSIAGGSATWANYDEICAKGWRNYVAGEQ